MCRGKKKITDNLGHHMLARKLVVWFVCHAKLHTLILVTLFGAGLAFPVVVTAPFRHNWYGDIVLYTGRQDVKLYRLVNLVNEALNPSFYFVWAFFAWSGTEGL